MQEGRDGLAQSIKCLTHKHKDLSLTLTTHIKKPSVVAHVCNPSVREIETGELPRLSAQPSLVREFQIQ